MIPVLNAEDYVASALRSVMAQSVEDFGITVVDDCSDDASRAISVRTLEQTKNVTVISTPRRMGVAGALNLGISHSDSEFIARLDADDLMSRNRLEQQLRRMQEEPRLGLLGTWIKTFGMRNRKIRFPTSHNGILAEMSLRNCIAHPSVMIRREAVEKFSTVFDPSFTNTEDWDLWERISHHYRLGNLPAFLTSYRLHNSQVSRAAAPEIDAKEEEIRNRFFCNCRLVDDLERPGSPLDENNRPHLQK